MREYEEGYPVDANDRYYQGAYPDPDRRNHSNFGIANVKRNAVPGGNKVRQDATDYLNERLKIMPHEETEVLLQKAEIAFAESGQGAIAQRIGFELGGHYEVTWNGTAYSCTAVEFDVGGIPAVGVGDEGFASSGEPTGSHPFIIIDTPSAIEAEIGSPSLAFVLDGSSSAVVAIVGVKVHTIDRKFLPNEAIGGVEIVTYAGDTQKANMTLGEIAKAVYSGKIVLFRVRGVIDIPLTESVNLDLLAAGETPAVAMARFSHISTSGVVTQYDVGMDGVISEGTENLRDNIYTIAVTNENGAWKTTSPYNEIEAYLGGGKLVRLEADYEYYQLWSANISAGELVFARYDGSKFEKFTVTKISGSATAGVTYEIT